MGLCVCGGGGLCVACGPVCGGGGALCSMWACVCGGGLCVACGPVGLCIVYERVCGPVCSVWACV